MSDLAAIRQRDECFVPVEGVAHQAEMDRRELLRLLDEVMADRNDADALNELRESALSESRRELDALADDRARWHDLTEQANAQRAAAVAINVDLGKELDRTLDDLTAARGEIARLREALDDAAAFARGIGEHAISISADQPGAQGQPAYADPGFMTRCTELCRLLGEAIAQEIEKRAALAAKGGA